MPSYQRYYDQTTGSLFYTDDNDQWRDLLLLDTHSGKHRTLIKHARIGDLAFNPADRSLWGVRHNLGTCQLVRIAPPYEQVDLTLSLPYGRNLHGLALSDLRRDLPR